MTTVTVRVDEITKKKAAEVAADFGFDLSTITRAFWKQMAMIMSFITEKTGEKHLLRQMNLINTKLLF